MSDVERLILTLEASTEKYDRALAKAKKQTDKKLKTTKIKLKWIYFKSYVFFSLMKIPFAKNYMIKRVFKISQKARSSALSRPSGS